MTVELPREPIHSPFGGSVAARVLRCPASVGLVEKVPAHLRKVSAYAGRGTALHAALALLLDDDAPFPESLAGKTFGNYTITSDDIATALRPVLDFVNRLLDAPGAEFYLERRVIFPGTADTFGTCDLLIRIGRTIYVIDFKFGSGVLVRARSGRRRRCDQRTAFVLRRGGAPFATRVLRRGREYRSHDPPARLDRAGRRDGLVGRGHECRAG